MFNAWVAKLGAGDIDARRDAILAGLARERPDVTTCVVELDGGDLKFRFKPARGVTGVPASLQEEAVRRTWTSRLYPVPNVIVSNADDSSKACLAVYLTGHHTKELRHRHGRRPYGRMPAEEG